jgi:hypothetical protein
MPESLQVGLVMPPTRFIHGAVRSIRQVIYLVVINFLGKRPLPWPGGGGFCVILGVWLPTHLPLEGSNHFRICEL